MALSFVKKFRRSGIVLFGACLSLSGQSNAYVLDEVLASMSQETIRMFMPIVDPLRVTAKEVFTAPGYYKDSIVKTFCPRPSMRAGRDPVAPQSIDMIINEAVWKCNNSQAVRAMLQGYWTVTGMDIESFLIRISLLTMIHDGQRTYMSTDRNGNPKKEEIKLIWGNPNTRYTEAAIQATEALPVHRRKSQESLEAFKRAVAQDVRNAAFKTFGDMGVLFNKVKVQVAIERKFKEIMPNGLSVEESVNKFFEEDLAELQRNAEEYLQQLGST